MQFITTILIFFGSAMAEAASAPEVDFYRHQVQPIFDARCISCHSCFNAPCQLNLQNFAGFERGAHKLNIYNATRTKSVAPTRLGIDAKTAAEWMKSRQFFSLNTSRNPEENLFLQALALKQAHPDVVPDKVVSESLQCPANIPEQRKMAVASRGWGMPYGLPALSAKQMATLTEWIRKGAPGPGAEALKELAEVPAAIESQIREWEKFFNGTEAKQRLLSRYMFEHLFLAQIYFPEQTQMSFRLVRSSSQCEKGADEIATRRPNDDPGRAFYYCFLKLSTTPVMKTRLPLEFSAAKLQRYKDIFFSTPWEVTELPSYNNTTSENPFVTFEKIPVEARYQFLLEDARYHVATFTNGPVCNGSKAVNSIQEQFYVFFLDPRSDHMVRSVEYARKAQRLLILPGMWGSDVTLKEVIPLARDLVDHREKYRKLRAQETQKNFPRGYRLKDIWDGDGKNDNAVLTVFRHDDNASVVKGALGDLPKTIFVMDYALFERLAYNLVINFDVFGNLGHQALTRIYMDMIRMEAEELFLSFLPPKQRTALRKDWYRGLLTEAKMNYVFPIVDKDLPTGIRYKKNSRAKEEWVEKVLFSRLNEKTRGPLDAMNWKSLSVPARYARGMKLDVVQKELTKIAAVPASGAEVFARFLPEFSYLLVKAGDGSSRIFSLILNRNHENISWILGESLRLAPAGNSLTIAESFMGAYPVQFFMIDEKDLKTFVKDIREVKSGEAYKKFTAIYGVPRMSGKFWMIYDEINGLFKKQNPTSFGYLDLTRYAL